MSQQTRTEKDTLGEIQVPLTAQWGAQTQRALSNTIAVSRLPDALWQALIQIKSAAAAVNSSLNEIDPEIAQAIQQAAQEILEKGDYSHFPLSPYMTGSGTSANMNVNEVLAHRASEKQNSNTRVHPNDHVNRGQSSNDSFPTAINIAAHQTLLKVTLPGMVHLRDQLQNKADALMDVIKLGRTHLMDALPVRLGAEFSAYAAQIDACIQRVHTALDELKNLPLGGTAVGTGVNAHPEFATRVIDLLNDELNAPFKQADNLFAALSSRDELVAASGALKTTAVALSKIANDIRWLGSGPNGGLGELKLPAVQPGSSIMPNKVNPVICEAVLQAAARVQGNDVTIAQCGSGGVLELNLMMPTMAATFIESALLIGEAAVLFADKCLIGLEPDEATCRAHLEKSLALVTPLANVIGYDKAAEIAKKAAREKITLREAALTMNVMDEKKLDALLDPESMV